MYTIEKVKTADLDPTGLPIWEVIVRDHHGHAVHHDYCYTCDLDGLVAELQAAFHDIPNPWCVKMTRRVADCILSEVFASGLTKEDALDLCARYDWCHVDENGFLWELSGESDTEAAEAMKNA